MTRRQSDSPSERSPSVLPGQERSGFLNELQLCCPFCSEGLQNNGLSKVSFYSPMVTLTGCCRRCGAIWDVVTGFAVDGETISTIG